jgi:hypothetical protein
MQRLVAIAMLGALTACGLVTHPQPQPVSLGSEKTIRRCVRHFGVSSGEASSVRGISGDQATYNEFGAANSFSDERMSAAWTIEERRLQLDVANRTPAEMVVDAVIVGNSQTPVTNSAFRVSPHAQGTIRLTLLGGVPTLEEERAGTAPAEPNSVELELSVRYGEEECSYVFRLVRRPRVPGHSHQGIFRLVTPHTSSSVQLPGYGCPPTKQTTQEDREGTGT